MVEVFSVISKKVVYPGDACAARLVVGNNRLIDKKPDLSENQVVATLKKPDGKKVTLSVEQYSKSAFIARFLPSQAGTYEILFSAEGDESFSEKGEIAISELVW